MGAEERYSRQVPLLSSKGQRRLESATVGIVGLGGLGSNVLTQLALAGVSSFILVDDQCPEESNLNRQFMHVGYTPDEGKASSAKRWAERLNPGSVIQALQADVRSDEAQRLLSRCDVLMDCLDSNGPRMSLNHLSISECIPLVHGAVEECRGQVTMVEPGRTACLRCFLPESNDDPIKNVLGAAAGTIGSIQAMEAIKHISGMGATLSGRLLVIDMIDNSYSLIPMSAREGCPDCAHLFRNRCV